MNSAGCRHVLLPESTLQCKHQLVQVNLVFVRKSFLAHKMVRIQILPVMSCTKRDRREIRGLLPKSPSAQDVRVGRFDKGRLTAHSRTDCASKGADPSQILRASVGTSSGAGSPSANRYSPFRRRALRQWHSSA